VVSDCAKLPQPHGFVSRLFAQGNHLALCREGTADGLMPAADGLGILERGVWESYFCSVVALLTTAHSSQAITWVLPKHKTHPFTPPLAAPYYLYLA